MSLKNCIREFVVVKSKYDSSERDLILHFLCSAFDINYDELIEKVNKEIRRLENAELRLSSG